MRYALVAVIISLVGQVQTPSQTISPPPTRVVEVVDVLHGIEVRDPYRWLEDEDSPDTRAWIELQTKYTRTLLDPLSVRSQVQALIADVESAQTRIGMATDGRRFLVSRIRPGEELASYYLSSGDLTSAQLLLAPPTNTDGRPLRLQFHGLSHDGSLLAYGLARGGAEQTEIAFLDLTANRRLPDRLRRPPNVTGTEWHLVSFRAAALHD